MSKLIHLLLHLLQAFGRHVASDRMVSGAYKTEYGHEQELQKVADKIQARSLITSP